MKTKSTQRFYKKGFVACSMFLTICVFSSCSVVENVPSTAANTKKVTSTAFQPAKNSRKDHSVRIYPDLLKRVMHVKNLQEFQLDFFVFDPDGTLVTHYKMSEKEHKKVSGLKAGAYIYQVFEGDAMCESGKLVIR